jgi:polyhydroxyalkanoate synthase subunit PhaC
MDDYVKAQIDAIDTVRELLDVKDVHLIGYCVAGTTLAATLALLEARGEALKASSATFFTAQVDFSEAGDLNLFVGDDQMQMIEQLSGKGYMDGRYMAATFNMLRGRDLIWNYVTNNYLLGEDYTPFDLLHWNSDTTNLPAKWHQAYLRDYYRDNKLVQPGGITIDGTPLNIGRVKTPTYVQAGREDHIAPAHSVWKITHHFLGPVRFVLAGSGHIAGVVNPPEAQKYQYWTNEDKVETLEDFIEGAKETKGSWWPDWLQWIKARSDETVFAMGPRVPGEGKLPAIEDAPGSYVKGR